MQEQVPTERNGPGIDRDPQRLVLNWCVRLAPLALLGLYEAYRGGGWRAAAFWTYLGLALPGFVGQTIATLRLGSHLGPTDQDFFYFAAEKAKYRKEGKLRAFLGKLSTVLAILGESLVWPAELILIGRIDARLRKLSRRSVQAQHALERLLSSDSFRLASVLAVLALVDISSRVLGQCTSYRRYLFLVSIAHISALLVSYALAPSVMTMKLKRHPRPVAVRIMTVVGMTYGVLILSFAGLEGCSASGRVEWADILRTARGLFVPSLKKAFTDWDGHLSIALLQAIVGYLLYVAMVRLVSTFKILKRDAGDDLWVSGDYMAVGEFEKGLKWADKLEDAERSPFWLYAKAIGNLGLGKITEAVQFGRPLVGILNASQPPDVYRVLLSNGVRYPIDNEVLEKLLRRWEEEGAPDITLAATTEQLFVPCGSLKIAQEWSNDASFARRRPFTFARLALRAGDRASARRALENAAIHTTVERYYKDLLLLRADVEEAIASGDRVSVYLTLSRWFGDKWPEVSKTAELVPDNYAMDVAVTLLGLRQLLIEQVPTDQPDPLVADIEHLADTLAKRAPDEFKGSFGGITQEAFRTMLRSVKA
jgi:hypothetical protein